MNRSGFGVPMAVFVFEGSDLSVFPSLSRAEGHLEVHDIGRFVVYGDDGRIYEASADGYRVKLAPTDTLRPEALRADLTGYLAHPEVGLAPDLADDPIRMAEVILEHDWALRPFQWWPWLDRRLNGSGPPGSEEP